MATLTVHQLAKRYDCEFVLENIELQLEGKEFLAVVGEDGDGKTTFIRLLAGLEEPSLGEIYLDGEPVYEGSPAQGNMAVVFEKPALYRDMSVYHNIAYALQLKKLPKATIKERVEQAMEILNLTELQTRKPRALTEREQQQVMLARAVAKQPKCLLLDEPFRAFGRESQTEFHETLLKLYEKMDTTVIYACRDSSDVKRMASRIFHLKGNTSSVKVCCEMENALL